jgi:hypothetical protein
VTFSGTTSWLPAPGAHEEITTWTMSTTLNATNEHDGIVRFSDVASPGTGSYSVDGFNNACSIDASGTFGASDMSIGLIVDTRTNTYGWDWIGLTNVTSTWHCPGDPDFERLTHVSAKEMVDGLAYNPDNDGALTAHRVIQADGDLTHDYTWTLTPAP